LENAHNEDLPICTVERQHGMGHFTNKVEVLFFLNVFLLFLIPIFLYVQSNMILVLAIIISLGSLIIFAKRLYLLKQLSTWKRVPAFVNKAQIKHLYFGRSGDKFCPEIHYSYTVDDHEYQSDQLFFEDAYCQDTLQSSEALMQSILRDGLYVYYDQEKVFQSYVFVTYNAKNTFFLFSLPMFSLFYIAWSLYAYIYS